MSVGPFVGVAAAHSSLIGASPAPGQAVGGDIERIELVFDAGISDATVTVESPTGRIVEGELEDGVPNVLTLIVDPDDMREEGNWVIRYEFISEDTDPVSLAYAFGYDLEAPAPLAASASTTTASSDDGESGGQTTITIAAIGTLGLAGAGAFASRRAKQARGLGAADR